MANFVEQPLSLMQKIGRFLKDAWKSIYDYGLYMRARFSPKPDGFQETLNKVWSNDSSLTRLDLHDKPLSFWNIIELCYALRGNKTLSSLDVSNTQIGDDCAKALAKNTTLKSLDARNNPISEIGKKALTENTTLTKFYLDNDAIDDDESVHSETRNLSNLDQVSIASPLLSSTTNYATKNPDNDFRRASPSINANGDNCLFFTPVTETPNVATKNEIKTKYQIPKPGRRGI